MLGLSCEKVVAKLECWPLPGLEKTGLQCDEVKEEDEEEEGMLGIVLELAKGSLFWCRKTESRDVCMLFSLGL